MSRLQLALNVNNLDEAIDFYSKMFGTKAAKIRPGYANFAIDDPPLKLVLFEGAGPTGSLNHLGVEVETAADVTSAEQRLSAEGLNPTEIADTLCCYAEKTETWITGPDATRWEWYVRTGDAEQLHSEIVTSADASSEQPCCAPEPVSIAAKPGSGNPCC